MDDTTPYARALVAHLESHWGPAVKAIDLAEGRRHELPDEFRVYTFRRHEGELAYVTVGMSEPGPDALELFLLAREHDASYELAELLFATAHFHRRGARLDVWHSVNFGRPWLPHSECTHALVSPAYVAGAALERPVGIETRMLWLLPVTPSELAFRRRHGTEALEQAFERAGLDYLDPKRRSVVGEEL